MGVFKQILIEETNRGIVMTDQQKDAWLWWDNSFGELDKIEIAIKHGFIYYPDTEFSIEFIEEIFLKERENGDIDD